MTLRGVDQLQVLLVGDDPSLESIILALAQSGFCVRGAATGAEGLEAFHARPPDAVLITSSLSDGPGITVCRQMVAAARVPVIIVKSTDREPTPDELEVDVVLSLELGAADFVARPERAQEVVARVRSVIRRQLPRVDGPMPYPPDDTVWVGPFEIDILGRQLFANGEAVHLSRREFDLLLVLASPPGVVHSREQLINRVWSDVELSDWRTLDKHIGHLRRKLEADPAHPICLRTVHRVGFRFDCSGDCLPRAIA